MIYAAGLGSALKKSQGQQAFTSTIDAITRNLVLDPDVSGMDAVIIIPKDVTGPRAATVQAAIDKKHPDVCVIYLYQSDVEKNLIHCEYSKQVKKLNDKAVTDAVTEFLGSHLIKAGKMEVVSNDFTIHGPATAITPEVPDAPDEPTKAEPVKQEPVPELIIPKTIVNPVTNEATVADDTEQQLAEQPFTLNEEKPVEQPAPTPTPTVTPDMQRSIDAIRDFHDFDLLKKGLEKDRVIAEVLAENADFNQVASMLDVLDSNIKTVFLDNTLTPEERYNKMKDLGLQRSTFKGKANDMIIKKTADIFDKTTTIVDEFVSKKVADIESALTKITLDKSVIESGGIDISHLIQERTKMELELMELVRNIIDTYKSMDTLVADELKDLDTNLPSSNSYVNDLMAPKRDMFTPENTSALASAIMDSLQNQRVTLSSMENKVRAVISVIFSICEQTDTIIEYQANLINLLKANKVEDIVVIDSMIKSALRLYIAAEDTGATATILTQSGLQSRTANTLIVDISGNGKWADYGITAHAWDSFITEHPHESLCVVTADGSDPEKIHDIVRHLKEALSYYQYINVKVDYTQTDAINQLCDDALVAHIITDCRASNVRRLKPAADAIWTKQIAKKLVLIDAPTDDILSVTKEIGCDVLTTKVISIPHLTEIKGCAISRKQPYLNDRIATVFEAAFR